MRNGAHYNGGSNISRTDVVGRLYRAPRPIRGGPEVEVKINVRPFPALLDSGSVVSLVQSCILAPRGETKASLQITCVHGDTQHVPAQKVTILAAPGLWPVEVGVVKDLSVPVLLGLPTSTSGCTVSSCSDERRPRKLSVAR